MEDRGLIRGRRAARFGIGVRHARNTPVISFPMGVVLMTRTFLMVVLVGVTLTSVAACNKAADEPKPASEAVQPAEPEPMPDKPET